MAARFRAEAVRELTIGRRVTTIETTIALPIPFPSQAVGLVDGRRREARAQIP